MSTVVASLRCFAAIQAFGQSPQEILNRVDQLRHPWPSFAVEIAVQNRSTRQRWQVTVRSNGDSRVEGLSEKEKGRTVLLLGDQMWLLLPNAKRPVKVSPQQRLLGPASGGDIMRFTFASDYDVVSDREDTLEDQPCRKLELQAKRPSISYRKAILWVAKGDRPLRTDFFLPSGKLARTAQFGPISPVRGVPALNSLRLIEPNGQETEIVFQNWKPVSVENRWFELPIEP